MQRDAGFQRVMLASVLAFGLAPAWVMAESSTTAAELSQDSLWAVWGCLLGDAIACFRTPVAGCPPFHWTC